MEQPTSRLTMSKTLSTTSQDALKGRQLTEQYRLAVGGMQQVLIFGAMMMQLRAEHPELAQKGNPRLQLPARGQLDGGQPVLTLSKWLETYAPEVKRQTAQRFLAVTEAIAQEYPQIVGVGVAKRIDLATLVTTPAKKLEDKLKAKQLELFEWVNGTSQRSWLDRFSSTRNAPPKPTKASAKKRGDNAADEVLQALRSSEAAAEFLHELQSMATAFSEFRQVLTEEDLAGWETEAGALLEAVRGELKTRRAAR